MPGQRTGTSGVRLLEFLTVSGFKQHVERTSETTALAFGPVARVRSDFGNRASVVPLGPESESGAHLPSRRTMNPYPLPGCPTIRASAPEAHALAAPYIRHLDG